MLTESELAWLVQRVPRGKVGAMFFSCHNCDEADKNPRRTKYKTCRYRCKIHKTHKYELQDALEFSERVATKLADTLYFELAPDEVRMMLARLEVEEEMDADEK